MSHCLFFFSSRRRHTRCSRDWSSDVCSSDLEERERTVVASAPSLGKIRWPDNHDEIWMFTFGPCEGLSPVQPQQVLDGLIRKAVQHNGGPAQRRGSDPDGPDRGARVVLAVAERALAVLPRLPPVNGRESNQEGLRRKRVQQFREQFGGGICAAPPPVLLGGVVVQPRWGCEAGQRTDQAGSLRGMQ